MALSLPVCRIGGIEPFQLPIKDNAVSTTSSATTRGISVNLGVDNELFSMRPSSNWNNTFVTSAYVCGDNPNATCTANYGGLYVPSEGVFSTPDQSSWNGTPGDLGGNNPGYRIIGFEDVMKIGGYEFPGFPFLSFEQISTGTSASSILGLGINSSFLEAALSAEVIGTKQWSYWPGNLNKGTDGLLVIGAYDQNRASGDFVKYEVDKDYRVPFIEIVGMDWEDASGETTDIMPNKTKNIFARVETFYPFVDMPTESYVKLMFATNYSTFNNVTGAVTWNSQPTGNLVVRLSDGTKTTIPTEDLFHHPVNYNDRGYLETVNTSYWSTYAWAMTLGEDPVYFGYPFLAQKLLVTDWDGGALYLADADKGSTGSPNLKALCTDPPMTNHTGTSPSENPTEPSKKSNAAAIGGGVGGGVGGLLLIGIIAFFVFRRKKQQKRKQQEPESYVSGMTESQYRESMTSAPPKYATTGIHETGDKSEAPERYHSPPPAQPPQEIYSPPPRSPHSPQPPPFHSSNHSPTPDTGSNPEHWSGTAPMNTASYADTSSNSRFGATSGPLEMPTDYDERYARQ